jgi:hypothetical protein
MLRAIPTAQTRQQSLMANKGPDAGFVQQISIAEILSS